MIALLVWMGVALAEPLGSVHRVYEPDDAGRWGRVSRSGQAFVVQANGSEIPLEEGLSLDKGQTLGARQARAEIRMSNGNRLELEPGAQITIQELGLIEQLLGKVVYSVKGAFSVHYGTVHCTVEGTQFQVEGLEDGGVQVGVMKGRVRVTTPTGEVVVRKKQDVRSDEEGTLGEVGVWKNCLICGYYHTPHD